MNHLEHQTSLAAEALHGTSHGIPAIITESRLSKNALKTFWGFRFDPSNACKVGDEIANGDGSLSIVRAIYS